MKLARSSLFWIAAALILVGITHSVHRHLEHGVPWLPGAAQTLWDVEATVQLEAGGDAVKVRLAVPDDPPGFRRVAEHTASPGYGLNFLEEVQRVAEWTTREANGPQVLYYRAQFQVDPTLGSRHPGEPPDIRRVAWSPSLQLASAQVPENAWLQSADGFSLARALVRRLNDGDNQNAQLLLSEYPPSTTLVRLLHQAEVPARTIHGLILEDGRRRQSLQPFVQVFNEGDWRLFDATAGVEINTDEVLLWERTGGPVLEVEGGRNSQVSFSMLETRQSAAGLGEQGTVTEAVFNLSIHSLPLSEQAIFQSILLLPLGALVVVFFRVIVGLETSGTFMPVLIALAFLEMNLLPGLITFLLVVGGGLLMRQAMAHLNLLLVARVSVVIVCVIGLISLLSVLSFDLGFTSGLKVALFPMIILAWTIERMSILWEEEGPRDVFKQGAGSLITAIAAFGLMQMNVVQHLMFNFLGLQPVVLAGIILLGSYTGYRLLELWRFRPFLAEGGGAR